MSRSERSQMPEDESPSKEDPLSTIKWNGTARDQDGGKMKRVSGIIPRQDDV